MTEDGRIKLGDFGLARVLQSESEFARSHVGTPYYMSPEQMFHARYNEQSDIWSLGCVIYELAALRPPFIGPSHALLMKQIREGVLAPLPSCYSDSLFTAICSMLHRATDRRLTVEKVLQLDRVKLAGAELVLDEREKELNRLQQDLKRWETELAEREQAVKLQAAEAAARARGDSMNDSDIMQLGRLPRFDLHGLEMLSPTSDTSSTTSHSRASLGGGSSALFRGITRSSSGDGTRASLIYATGTPVPDRIGSAAARKSRLGLLAAPSAAPASRQEEEGSDVITVRAAGDKPKTPAPRTRSLSVQEHVSRGLMQGFLGKASPSENTPISAMAQPWPVLKPRRTVSQLQLPTTGTVPALAPGPTLHPLHQRDANTLAVGSNEPGYLISQTN